MAKDEPTLAEPAGWQDDYQLAYPSKYLGQQHLRGQDLTLTITKVELPELEMVKPGMRPQKKRKLVLHFGALENRTDGMPSMWIVGKTSAHVIADLYGKKPREWVGKRITLYADPDVMFGREKTGGLRVRPRVPPERSQRAGGGASPSTQELPPAAGDASVKDPF